MIIKAKSVLLFSAMLSAGSIYAGGVAVNANNLGVVIPVFKPGFEFTGAALALKPGANNLNYVINNKELPAQSPTWTETEIQPGYQGAFALGARYLFAEGQDVSLGWIHLNSSTSTNLAADGVSYFLGPDYQIGPDSIPIRSAQGNAKFYYDVINLDVGQFVNFGSHVQMRFLGGLSNTYLRETVTATYVGNVLEGNFPGPFSTEQQVVAKFTGVGPRIGINGSYDTHYGFGFVGEGAVSALIGSAYTKTNFNSSAVELEDIYHQANNYQFIKDKSVTQVIPAFDGKLGVSYKHMFNNEMLLNVEGGYFAAVYVNAINQYLPQTLVEDMSVGGIYVATMSHTQSSYSVQGPYLQASLKI